MQAVGYHQPLPIDHPESLQDLRLPAPQASELDPHDLLVAVSAVSVNPVDTKVRRSRAPAPGQAEVLGWDAVGTVQAVGSAVSLFQPGDRVWYAGSIVRPGSNAQLQRVDERIVGRAPRTLSDAQAAALPLTAITAWELLFDRFGVPLQADAAGGAGQTLLIVGAAGGVGSILIQLARQLTGLTVVATASRPETRQWCLDLGAHQVIDHHQPWAPQLQAAGVGPVHRVASLTHTGQHVAQIIDALAPQGQLGLIDDFEPGAVDLMAFKAKCLSLHWELMFTRSRFGTPDMVQQHQLLQRVSELVDAGRLRSTEGEHMGAINAANLRRAHAWIESGRARGKVVLQGWA
ncbi:zinc-binding alcohol dehydrogenase family protein [Curvibacter sp. HBC61]|uniref:Zinc-type alcohol dehydrogenase-like protein n=1 Tax=Curvibacter cyanobacteriorum TaxID=3026422 RepID=A0ABT5MXU5_9BURK|nr:zinc-binding alcohol dehydrogenase family protein [Curvibacter sp. HBC61]MDD0838857.1 zinc-binding alcohol dehydrogenase family protein [Curvibacter sp. HBC61]